MREVSLGRVSGTFQKLTESHCISCSPLHNNIITNLVASNNSHLLSDISVAHMSRHIGAGSSVSESLAGCNQVLARLWSHLKTGSDRDLYVAMGNIQFFSFLHIPGPMASISYGCWWEAALSPCHVAFLYIKKSVFIHFGGGVVQREWEKENSKQLPC